MCVCLKGSNSKKETILHIQGHKRGGVLENRNGRNILFSSVFEVGFCYVTPLSWHLLSSYLAYSSSWHYMCAAHGENINSENYRSYVSLYVTQDLSQYT